jgi:N6-L-threonylcarbamoyladenine synthase
MLHSGDFDFSFSGLKTSVLYKVRELEKIGKLSQEMKAVFAREFQAAVVEVLTKKSLAAIKKYKTKTLIIGGGVIANKALRKSFEQITNGSLGGSQGINLLVPDLGLTGDNATMIAAAASLRLWSRKKTFSHHQKITARGDLSLK